MLAFPIIVVIDLEHGCFRTKIKCVRTRCDSFICIEGQRLYEKFMHTKGRGSPAYEVLAHTKYSGFTIHVPVNQKVDNLWFREKVCW